MTTNEIRIVLRDIYGSLRYRITADGEIHVYATMPNTNEAGWYFFGWVGDADTETRIRLLAAL